MRRTALSLLLAAAAALVAPAASAQSQVEEARMLFKAGEQAYVKTNYRKAIQAFSEANKLAPRPAVLFSMAQAYRQLWALEQQPSDLRQAVDLYRQYVAQVPQGGRRADAAQALLDLGPAVARLTSDAPGEAPAPVEVKVETLLSVMCSTPGSTVSVNGGKPVPTPIMPEVEPGQHKVRLTAPGFVSEERDVLVRKGRVSTVDVTLSEVPARVTFVAPTSAQVSVDGRSIGPTPLPQPLKLSSGRHFITVTKNGYKPFTDEVDLARAKDHEIKANLSITGQRVVSYSFFGAGAAGIGVGIVAGLVTGHYQDQAKKVDDERQQRSIDVERRDAFNGYLEKRDNWARVAGAGFGLGAAFGAASFLLYVFDEPTVTRVPQLEVKPKTEAPPSADPMDLTASPAWSPGYLGGTVTGRF